MPRADQVWVIDDDRSIRWVLDRALKKADFDVTLFEDATRALSALQQSTPDAIITDVRMPGIDGLDFLNRLQHELPDLPIIIMTAHSDLDSAVSAYQGGAFDYLPKPFDVDDAVALTRRACMQAKHASAAEQELLAASPEIIGEAPAMQDLFRAIGRLSRAHVTVLLTGESGSGKELVARALHRHSPRADKEFIALNMAAIPKDLLESELFGHEKGAFTGAHSKRAGRFAQADGGTLFLDEIGDMPAELQTRLLRVLSDGEFYSVGGHTPIKVDVRIIAATHQNLEQRVNQGSFRDDLFHRLNVIHLQIPALRERREDIPLLLKHFLHRAAEQLEVEPKALQPEVNDYLSKLAWPGNVRQLENLCHWLTVMAATREITLSDLPPEMRAQPRAGAEPDWQSELSMWAEHELAAGTTDLLAQATPIFEAAMIKAAMHKTGGKRERAAKLLGWGRNTLTRKIKELCMYQDIGQLESDNPDQDND